MRLKATFVPIILALFIVACDDKDEPRFVPGDVIIGIKSTTSIKSVFDLMNEKNVTIDQMSGFFNDSTFPNDSLDYIINILKDKTYLNKRGFKGGSAYIHAIENKIMVTQFLFEMTIEAQQDWLATMDILKLNDLGDDTKNLVIKVTPGTEAYWMQIFKAHPDVKWVELNILSKPDPLPPMPH